MTKSHRAKISHSPIQRVARMQVMLKLSGSDKRCLALMDYLASRGRPNNARRDGLIFLASIGLEVLSLQAQHHTRPPLNRTPHGESPPAATHFETEGEIAAAIGKIFSNQGVSKT